MGAFNFRNINIKLKILTEDFLKLVKYLLLSVSEYKTKLSNYRIQITFSIVFIFTNFIQATKLTVQVLFFKVYQLKS